MNDHKFRVRQLLTVPAWIAAASGVYLVMTASLAVAGIGRIAGGLILLAFGAVIILRHRRDSKKGNHS